MALNNKEVMATFKEGTQAFDIMNAIRNESTQGYKDYVPLASKDNVAALQHAFKTNQQLMNEFFQALVNKIVKTIFVQLAVRQPLEKFKSGSQELGDTVEEIYTALSDGHIYDPETGEKEVWKREKPNVSAFYHKLNRQEFYKQTISDAEIINAFNSWQGVENLVTKVVNNMYNSNRRDEYRYMKLIIDTAFANGAFYVVPVGDLDTAQGQNTFLEKAREYSLLIEDLHTFTPTGVENNSEQGTQNIIIPAKTQAKIDVNQLASAFNMDKKDFISSRTNINYFGSSDIYAVLVDSAFWVVFDKLFEFRTLPNPENLETTYWLHVHQTLSYSPFNTAIAFVKSATEPITNIIFDKPVTVLGKNPVMLKVKIITAEGLEVPEGEFTYSTNLPTELTITPGDDNTITVTATDNAVPGDLATITATYTVGEKTYTGTAHVQISTRVLLG